MSKPAKLAFAVAIAVAALDQLGKWLAVELLSGKGLVNVLGGNFHFELYRNFAGPGGRFAGHVVLISIFTVVAVAALAVAATRVRSTGTALAVRLLLGGGLGNGLDRLLRAPGPFEGGVVDWIKPSLDSGSMNIADLAINAGVAVIVVVALLSWWRERRRDQPAPIS